MQWYLLGSVAALLTTFGFVPQVSKMLRTKSVKDVSLPTFLQFGVGMSLWAVYGFHLRDAVIIAANCVGVLIIMVAISVYIYYVRRTAWAA